MFCKCAVITDQQALQQTLKTAKKLLYCNPQSANVQAALEKLITNDELNIVLEKWEEKSGIITLVKLQIKTE